MEISAHSSFDETISNNSSNTVCSTSNSLFSRGHTRSNGSGSSSASSPMLRDSFDLYPTHKRLEDVTEEKDELEGYTLVDDKYYFVDDYTEAFAQLKDQSLPLTPPSQTDYSGGDQEVWTTSDHQHKRAQKSSDQTNNAQHRFSDRFGSISRRWKNRSIASPQLSIVTHSNISGSRSSSITSPHVISPALSAISKHESHLPASPHLTRENSLHEVEIDPIPIQSDLVIPQEEPIQATTPLLPPIFTELSKKDSPVQSPLQSPAIAPTSTTGGSISTPTMSGLPSPPLSTKPSIVSMHQRSRANTATNTPLADIPPILLLDEQNDPWAIRLGHANFNIFPEPYVPERIDLESYTEFRESWDQARTCYARHLARTIEHYGGTSKVFKLTEEKWTSIDNTWKKHNDLLSEKLRPVLTRISDGDIDITDSLNTSSVLEKPITKVIMPAIDDKSGKFPEIGDGEIVGPMSVARPRALSGQRQHTISPSPPVSPRKRNFLKFLSDMFGRTH